MDKKMQVRQHQKRERRPVLPSRLSKMRSSIETDCLYWWTDYTRDTENIWSKQSRKMSGGMRSCSRKLLRSSEENGTNE
jgi:hypothetical protein